MRTNIAIVVVLLLIFSVVIYLSLWPPYVAGEQVGARQEPLRYLPLYLSFIGTMMTAVTVVLAAVAIGIAILAAFTLREVHQRVDQRVDTMMTERMEKFETKLGKEAARIIAKNYLNNSQNPTLAELEGDFDSDDTSGL